MVENAATGRQNHIPGAGPRPNIVQQLLGYSIMYSHYHHHQIASLPATLH